MKKVFKTIAKVYALYLASQVIAFGISYIYGCIKYGRNLMNWSVRFSMNAYKAWVEVKLMQLGFKIKPTTLDTSDMLDWSSLD